LNVQRQFIISAELGQMYTARSDTWGSAPRFVLCGKNVHEFENASSLAERSKNIPQTFLNAMDVGIDYLWTDALCIVQNDKEVIQSHLANMVIIYDNAEHHREHCYERVGGMPSYPSFARRETQVQYQVDGVQLINTKPIFTETLKGCLWESLAWTLQGKVFLKRILIFRVSSLREPWASPSEVDEKDFNQLSYLSRG
jgi:Heterokaryon incompatibility protein (HET)